MTVRFSAAPEDEGDRLDVALARWLGESRSRSAARISRGEVRVGDRLPAKSQRLTAGESVTIAEPPELPYGAAGVTPPPVRWEDEHLLVVAKPAGLVVHPGVGHPAGTLVQALVEAGVPLARAGGSERPGIVHRLDRDTSGLMVIAKSDVAHAGLVGLLRRREVERLYLVLVEKIPPAETGRIEAPIGRDPRDRKRFTVVAGGKPAATRWRLMGKGRAGQRTGVPVALLVCRLETGRTHQIRVHFSHAGHVVAGDLLYGSRPDVAEALELERPFLHAARLAFPHPVTGEAIVVDEPLPDELVRSSERAGLGAQVRLTWADAE
ncbi:MAG: RluA family pseudouridine synthase [Nitriliruptorales bacterium]